VLGWRWKKETKKKPLIESDPHYPSEKLSKKPQENMKGD